MRISKKVERTITTYVCDLCGKEDSIMRSCGMCKRDACSKCRIIQFTDIVADQDNGDYPDYYCSECDKIKKKYIYQFKEIHNEYDNKIEALANQFKKECLDNKETPNE